MKGLTLKYLKPPKTPGQSTRLTESKFLGGGDLSTSEQPFSTITISRQFKKLPEQVRLLAKQVRE
jgi:hypothetical protein